MICNDSHTLPVTSPNVAKVTRQTPPALLTRCAGDVSGAAREAQVPRGTLYRLLKKCGINPDEFRR